MRPHVGAETLARFRQGDLSRRKRARISAHLTRCGRCSELNGALAGVTTLLAGAAPPPMPEHLTARIQTALATEAARRVGAVAGNGTAASPAASPAAPAPAAAAGPVPPDDERRPRRDRPAASQRARLRRLSTRATLGTLAAAAALVVVAGGSYELFGHGAPTSSSSASSAQASRPIGGPLARPTGGSAGLKAPAAVGPALPYRYAGQQHTVTAIASGTDYTSQHLGRQVAAEVARYSVAGLQAAPNAMTPSGTAGSHASGPNARPSALRVPVAVLSGCVNRIAAGKRVLLVDVARYQGAAATVIVTEGSASAPEQVWVVGTECSGSRSDVLQRTALTPSG
jgi:hypothetical protein